MTLWRHRGLNGRNGMCQVFNSPNTSQEILFKLLQMFSLCSLLAHHADQWWLKEVLGWFGIRGKRVEICGNTVDGRNPAPYGKYPIIFRVLYIPGGWPWDFFHHDDICGRGSPQTLRTQPHVHSIKVKCTIPFGKRSESPQLVLYKYTPVAHNLPSKHFHSCSKTSRQTGYSRLQFLGPYFLFSKLLFRFRLLLTQKKQLSSAIEIIQNFDNVFDMILAVFYQHIFNCQ